MEEREARLFLANMHRGISPKEKPNFIYERYTLWHVGGLALARALNVPFILEINSPLPEEAQRYRSLANEPLAEGIARLLFREADGLVCVSLEVARWVAELRGHTEGVWVIPNGVDPKVFSPHRESRPAPLPPPEVPLVGFCGSFRPWHGVDDLLEAFSILVENDLHEAHLVCVGDGPTRQSFEDKVRSRGMTDRVHLTGQLPQEEVPLWLGGADLAVAPYPRLEQFYFSPLKIFEFLSLGLPVVTTDLGQLRELIPHRERGFLCDPGDTRDLAKAMGFLLRHPDEAQRLAEAGRTWVLEHATWEQRSQEILNNIQELA